MLGMRKSIVFVPRQVLPLQRFAYRSGRRRSSGAVRPVAGAVACTSERSQVRCRSSQRLIAFGCPAQIVRALPCCFDEADRLRDRDRAGCAQLGPG